MTTESIPERKSYRKIYRRLWSNADFRALTDSERVVALYVLAGPQTNRIGLFRFSVPLAAEDLGRPVNSVRRQFDHVCTRFGWQWDTSARVLYIPSWWKYNAPPKQDHNFRGALTDLNDVPRTRLMSLFCTNLDDIPTSQRDIVSAWQSLGTAEAEASLPNQTKPNIDKDRDVHQTATLRSAVLERFERFWSSYPRRIGKDAARKEWLQRSPDNDLTDRIIAAVTEQRASAQWLKDGGQFIPHPRTWLHQGRWQDDITPQARRESTPDMNGHVPQCRTRAECMAKLLAEAREEDKAAAS